MTIMPTSELSFCVYSQKNCVKNLNLKLSTLERKRACFIAITADDGLWFYVSSIKE